jgi:predicted AlkP superfamily pyrophosphatase or phosphodiesterase
MKRLIRTLALVLVGMCALGNNDRYGADDDRNSRGDEDKHSTRTILISFDGAQPQVIHKMLQSGRLPRNGGFGTLIREGTRADGMTAVLPTVTATNHITLATGAYPERTNIPANTFHLTNTSLTATTSGFSETIEAETLWEAAKRQRKKVITIAFAGADGRGAARRGDQTLGFGVRDGFSSVKSMNGSHFSVDAANAWNLGGQACEFKQANIGTLTANQIFFQTFTIGRVDLNLMVCDTIFDGQEKYDTAIFDLDKDISNGVIARMHQGDWAPFKLPLSVPPDATFSDMARGTVGAWVKVIAFDPTLSNVRIYLGDVVHNVGYPQSFVDDIDKRVGFWPGEPDFFNMEAGNIDEATYMTQLERLSNYLKDAMLLAVDRYDFDLLMGYQVQTDEAGHEFFLVDPRQQSYSDTAKRARFAGYVERAYQIADENLREIIVQTRLWKTDVIAVSDHGMAPLHTQGFPNRILRAAGLVEVTSTGAVDATKSLTNAVTVGGAANIYINLQGREPTGIVPMEQYETLQNQIVETFKAILDPVTNEPVFEIIIKKPREAINLSRKSNSHFKHEDDKEAQRKPQDFHSMGDDSGDVLIVSRPGYNFDFNAGTGTSIGNFFQPSTFFGQHGFDPNLAEMKAIFYAAGPDFKERRLSNVDNIDVAPTVAGLIGIKPPADAQGKKIKDGK